MLLMNTDKSLPMYLRTFLPINLLPTYLCGNDTTMKWVPKTIHFSFYSDSLVHMGRTNVIVSINFQSQLSIL